MDPWSSRILITDLKEQKYNTTTEGSAVTFPHFTLLLSITPLSLSPVYYSGTDSDCHNNSNY